MANICTKTLDLDAAAVDFAFGDGETITVKLADFTDDIGAHLVLHGISQKLGDAFSGAKGDVAVAKEKFQAALKQLLNGEWRAARGEGEAKPRTTELAAALVRITGKTMEEVAASLATADDAKRKALRSNERVKAVIALIRAEKAQERLAKLADEKIDF